MTPDELAEVMVVMPGRKADTADVIAWLESPHAELPVYVPPVPILPEANWPPVLRELCRRQARDQAFLASWTAMQRRKNVALHTVLLQGLQSFPHREQIWRWMDEHFAVTVAHYEKVLADGVQILTQLRVRSLDLLARGAVILRLGWLGRLWTRWSR